MEYQKTLLDMQVEYETILDEEEDFINENDEPGDLADQYYEEWRDEIGSRDKLKND